MTSVLPSLHGQLLMIQDLTWALKVDNVEVYFILSGISFRNLGPKLDVMLVPKCAVVCMFLQAKCIQFVRFSDVFRGLRKGALGRNGLMCS